MALGFNYEEIRRKNLEDNKRILVELGLSNPFRAVSCVVKKGIKRSSNELCQPEKRRVLPCTSFDEENAGSIRGVRRLSARLRGKPVGTVDIEDDDILEKKAVNRVKCVMPDRPNWYGQIPGIPVGTIWMTRIECCHDGIHRPTVAGIHGGGDGAYSIALSGGYEDDIDLGDCFTYTGEGGRDLRGTKNNPKNLRTAPQSKDQTLTRGNLALSKSAQTGNPIRVIRGYKLNSPFAPDEGYRYDGLYTVEKFWFTKGLSGHGVWKFALRRSPDQTPPPWDVMQDAVSPSKSSDSGFSENSCDSSSSGVPKSNLSDLNSSLNEACVNDVRSGSDSKDSSSASNPSYAFSG